MALTTARARANDMSNARQTAQTDLDALMDNEWLDVDIETLAERAKAASEAATQARLEFDQAVSEESEISQNLTSAQQREKTIDAQMADWQARLADTDKRKHEMAARAQQAKEERASLAERPKALEARKHQLAEQLDAENTIRQGKSDALRHAEIALSEADIAMRDSNAN